MVGGGIVLASTLHQKFVDVCGSSCQGSRDKTFHRNVLTRGTTNIVN